MVKDA